MSWRRNQDPMCHTAEADRGSEMGDCMEFLDDEFDDGDGILSDRR